MSNQRELLAELIEKIKEIIPLLNKEAQDWYAEYDADKRVVNFHYPDKTYVSLADMSFAEASMLEILERNNALAKGKRWEMDLRAKDPEKFDAISNHPLMKPHLEVIAKYEQRSE